MPVLRFILTLIFTLTPDPRSLDPGFAARKGLGTYRELALAIDAVEQEAKADPKKPEWIEHLSRKLWCFTGTPRPMSRFSMDELPAHWGQILDAYRKMATDAQEHGTSFEQFIRVNLKETIDAMDTPSGRARHALHVLRWWVQIGLPGVSSVRAVGPSTPGDVEWETVFTERSRRELRQRLERWYSENSKRMTWDASASAFRPDDGTHFEWPLRGWTPEPERLTTRAIGPDAPRDK